MRSLLKRLGFICLLITTFFIIILCSLLRTFILNSNNILININGYMDENFKYKVNIGYQKLNNDLYCSLDNKNWLTINNCEFNLSEGKYKVFIKNKYNKINKSFTIKKKILGDFNSSLDNIPIYYLALNGTKKINFNFNYPLDFDKSIIWKISNKDIISIKDDTIIGENVGESDITAKLKDGNEKTYHIVVTDLIIPPNYNNKKPYLPCKKYSKEENDLLDKILMSRVQEVGVGTRAGIAAAARFLTLEFPYSIRYFNENGRLIDHGSRPHIDAEGRYYHKGLYLHESRFSQLEKGASTKSGPKIWGCNLYDKFIKKYNMNGFTCSGFVTWAMLNGGFDVGDVGAGNYKQYNDDLSDLGEHKKITSEYMKTGDYKVGDFIGRNGHAALIIGIDEKNIYTAESLPPKLMIYTYERYNGIVKDDNLTYIIEMGNIYPNGDGVLTDMW